MTASDHALTLIKTFEGCRLTAYPDVGGRPTLGYGTIELNGQPIVVGQTCTQAEAEAALAADVQRVVHGLSLLLFVPVTQNQFDALVDFCYNLGCGAFASSSLRRAINTGAPVTEDLFTRWDNVRVNGVLTPVAGLTRRRKAEYALYVS